MEDGKLKKETYLPYPICFKKYRIGPESIFEYRNYENNEFYKERIFAPHKFYKAIIKL